MIFSLFFPLLLNREKKIHRKKNHKNPKQLLCISVHEINECISQLSFGVEVRELINNLEIVAASWFPEMQLACANMRHMLHSLGTEQRFNSSTINIICKWGCAQSQIPGMSINLLHSVGFVIWGVTSH